MLSTTLVVIGNQITGQGNVQLQCSPESTVGGSFNLSGVISNDGSFTAVSSNPGAPPDPSLALFQIMLSGNSPPAASPGLWSGNYTLSSSATAITGTQTCSYSHSASFTAASIAPLNGMYAGQGYSGPFPGHGNPTVAYTLQVSQGSPTLFTRGNFSAYQLPLSATLTVTGSTCFTTGTTAGDIASSYIAGDTITIDFLMNDGSHLGLSGSLTDPTGATLSVTGSVFGGACNLAFTSATLTRS